MQMQSSCKNSSNNTHITTNNNMSTQAGMAQREGGRAQKPQAW
jgi:hypothetical protein